MVDFGGVYFMNFFDWSYRLAVTAAKNGSCTQPDREVRGKFQSAISQRCDKVNPKFLCVDVGTIYGYYQSRFGSLGLSYKGVPMPFYAQLFCTPKPVGCRLNLLI